MPDSFQDVGLRVVLLGVREFERSADKVDKSIRDTNRSLDSTSTSTKRASESLSSYSDRADRAGKRTADLGRETRTLGQRFSDLGSRITTLGAVLTASLTVPLNALRATMINTGIEFEDAFSNVGKTVDGVVDDFGNLTEVGEDFRKELIDISLRLPISANELANVAAAAGQIGIPFGESGEILLEFTEIVSKLAVATNLTAEEGAIQIARFANIYGVSADEMIGFTNGFANALVALGNTTAANEQEILNFATRLAPFTSLANISADATLALGASMAEMGIRAEAGSTALSTIIQTMDQASKSASGTQAAWDESNREMQEGLIKLEELLRSGVRDLTELEYELQGTGLNLEGLGSMLNKLDGDFTSINTSIQRTQNSIAKYTAQIQELRDQQQRLRVEVNAGVISQEEYVQQAAKLDDKIDSLQYSLDNAELSLNNYNNSLSDMRSEMVSVDDVIKHVSMQTLMDMNDAMETAKEKTAIFADILGVTEKQFSLAFGADPVGTLVKFLEALADLQDAGLVTDETLTELGFSGIRVRTVFQAVGAETKGMVENLDLAADAWVEQTALQAEVTKKFATTKAQIQLMKNAFNALGIAVFDYVKPSFDAMIKTATSLITQFKDFFQASDKNKAIISKLFVAASLLGPALIAIGTSMRIVSIASAQMKLSMASALGPITLLIAAGAALYFVWTKNLFGLQDRVKDFTQNFINEFDRLGRSIKTGDSIGVIINIGSIIDALIGTITGKRGGIEKALMGIISVINPWARVLKAQLLSVFKNVFSGDFGGALESAKGLGSTLSDFFTAIVAPAIVGAIPGIKEWIVKSAPEFANALVAWIKAVGTFQAQIISEMTKLFAGLFDNVINSVFGADINTSGFFKGLAPLITVGLKGVFDDVLRGDFSDAFKNLKLVAKVFFTTWRGAWGTEIPNFINNVLNTLKEIGNAVITWAKTDGLTAIKNAFNTLFNIISGLDISVEGVILSLVEATGFILGALVTVIAGAIKFVVDEIGPFLAGVDWDAVLSSIGDFLGEVVKRFGEGFLEGIRTVMGKEQFDVLTRDIMGWLTKSLEERAMDAVKVLDAVWDLIWRGLWTALEFVWNSVLKPGIETIFNGLVSFVKKLLGISSPSKVFMDIGEDIINGLWDGIKFIWNTFRSYIEDRIEDFLKWWTDKLANFLQFGQDVVTNIWNGIKSLWSMFIEGIKAKIIEFVTNWTNTIPSLYNFGKNVVTTIQGGIQWGWNLFIAWVSDKANEIKTKFESTIDRMKEIGQSIVDGLKEGINNAWDAFIDWITDKIKSIPVVGEIVLAVGSPSRVMAELGENIVEGLQVGMEDKFPEVFAALKNAFSNMEMTANIAGTGLSSAMVGAATGSTIMDTSYTTNISNSRTFAPTIQGVPMRDERAVGTELVRSWRMAQVIGNI